jgi:glycogen operon protein
VLGATITPEGTDFAVHAGHADAVELCLFGDREDTRGESGLERRIPLVEQAHGTWFGSVPDVGAGQRYGYRVHGPWLPDEGQRHNPDKLLLDPYARAVDGEVTWRPEVFGHVVDEAFRGSGEQRDPRDSAPYVPRGVVLGDGFDWGEDNSPFVPWDRTVVYEAHVRNVTARHPGVPEHLRGTFAGMAHPAVLEHLTSLGVTAVELLPVQAFTHEPALVRQGLTNHWGYNTLGFFAPHAAYAAADDPQGVLDEFKGMVKLLHAAGLEVLLDVVYNHTAEQGGHEGATLSWRGFDNRGYYRLDGRGQDVDVTGCGNTLDLRNIDTCRMVLDSLRYWVREMRVDGFRFDLAPALARGMDDAFDPDHPFLVALRTDPLLSRVKLVAEPWDVGLHGWHTGEFPPPFAEWNDRFRDGVRTFWLPDVARDAAGQPGHGVRELATRLAGSNDLFGPEDRGPLSSVNFVTAHDGFTLADTTAYEHKHNEANAQDGRDGSDTNHTWNHGTEGPTDDPPTTTARRRSLRNLLATLLFSTGVPMISSGAELGRTQRGNNNAYCQDNEISWLDWELADWQQDLLATSRFLVGLRRDHPIFRQRAFFDGRSVRPDGTAFDHWYAADGAPMHDGIWNDPRCRTLLLFLDGSLLEADSALVVFHGGHGDTEVHLPSITDVTSYELWWDSAQERPAATLVNAAPVGPCQAVTVTGASIRVYRAVTHPCRQLR